MKTPNKTKTLQVRLTEEDYEYLTKAAFAMGTNPSALVRQLVQMSINAVKSGEEEGKRLAKEKEKERELLNEHN